MGCNARKTSKQTNSKVKVNLIDIIFNNGYQFYAIYRKKVWNISKGNTKYYKVKVILPSTLYSMG